MQLDNTQLAQFNQEGFLVLPRIIPDEMLEILRSGAQGAVDSIDRAMEAQNVERIGINLKGRRYFSINPSHNTPEIYQFAFSDLMANIAQQLLASDTVTAFWEQYVIKGPDPSDDARFSWHQDSAYVPFQHARYLTCWCALDDMSEANGTARILPFSRGPSTYVEHQKDPVTNDEVGYFGDDKGEPVICPAGSIAFFTSHTLHCSGSNPSGNWRRVYLIQYAAEIIQDPDDWKPYGRCEPLWINGKRVLRSA